MTKMPEMKNLVLFFMCFSFVQTYGQKATATDQNVKTVKIRCKAGPLIVNKPLFFVDSVRVIEEVVSSLNLNDIMEVCVVKKGYDSISKTEGEIYIFMKKGKSIKMFDFASFKAKYITNAAKPIILMLNGTFATNYANFIIDENIISKVEIDKGADIEPIKKLYANYTIVNILTKETFNTNSISQILGAEKR
jgi:hypothetical protein